METLRQDLRFAVRLLLKEPGDGIIDRGESSSCR
jgi:hypothetical protein